MTRYLGWKPVNWPAYVLVFGWIALSVPLFFFNDAVISQFPRAFQSEPLIWWPDMDLTGLSLVMSPMAYGALALWLMPKVDWSPKVGAVLMGLGTISFLAGLVWCAFSGVAVYPDRVIYREPGVRQPIRTERFSDIRRVEVSCSFSRRRRGSTGAPEASYDLVFRSGYRVDVWSTPKFPQDQSPGETLARVRLIAREADAVDAVHAPRRMSGGALIGDKGCSRLLAARYRVSPDVIAGLLSVYQSELRPGEYVSMPPAS